MTIPPFTGWCPKSGSKFSRGVNEHARAHLRAYAATSRDAWATKKSTGLGSHLINEKMYYALLDEKGGVDTHLAWDLVFL